MRLVNGWWCPDILSGPGKFVRRAEVIPYALNLWTGPRRRVIQAGAHIGTFPRRLAQHFAQVVCVEPAPENWECLVRNTQATACIMRYYGVLGAVRGTTAVNIQPHGTGGHHVITRRDRRHVPVTCLTIDDWGYEDVDAIFLDTEGFELFVLQGAIETLAQCAPLLVIEDNGCSRKFDVAPGKVGMWLQERFGYQEVGRYGEDCIFVAGDVGGQRCPRKRNALGNGLSPQGITRVRCVSITRQYYHSDNVLSSATVLLGILTGEKATPGRKTSSALHRTGKRVERLEMDCTYPGNGLVVDPTSTGYVLVTSSCRHCFDGRAQYKSLALSLMAA